VEALGIHTGSTLVLEHIAPANAVRGTGDDAGTRIVVTSEDGLRLYLGQDQAARVIVADQAQADAT
jgi:hypothetical protein